MTESLQKLQCEITACRICIEQPSGTPLPHQPKPVAVLSSTAKIAICGQAPGNRVHRSGKPFTDPSGDRLREWLGVDEVQFYDAAKFAIVPMGFCFPGYAKNGGDLPPRRECRAHWHDRIFAAMPQLQAKLLIGASAQAYHLGRRRKANVTQTVRHWRAYFAGQSGVMEVPMPHPSWRNTAWIKKNPWFTNDLLPEIRDLIQRLI